MIIIKKKEENDEIKNREKNIYIYICTIAQERGKIY